MDNVSGIYDPLLSGDSGCEQGIKSVVAGRREILPLRAVFALRV